jgi:hypothetical protein
MKKSIWIILHPGIAALFVTALGCGAVRTNDGPDAQGPLPNPDALKPDALEPDAPAVPSCTPGVALCNADGLTLETCDASGVAHPTDTCLLSCVADSGVVPAHCEHIVPPYLPNVCDTAATTASVSLTGGTIDPGLDASCTTIVSQTNGPDICVVRADTITISGSVAIAQGSGEPDRAIAFVADHDLIVSGTSSLDLSAHGASSGPGAYGASGVPGSSSSGGGGAGSFTQGGNGGNDTNGDGGAGGALISPPLAVLSGGPSAGSCTGISCSEAHHDFGGGGGGGVMLASCVGTVTVSGVVNAAGGGGEGAQFEIITDTILPPDGGGAGGNVVIAGASVNVTGSVYANGGGGGGGCNDQTGVGPCPGGNGEDGQASLIAASGGASGVSNGAPGTGASGGQGGFGTNAPTIGLASGDIPSGPGGGGGGAAGHLQVYAPQGSTPSINPAQASPPFDPTLAIPTR